MIDYASKLQQMQCEINTLQNEISILRHEHEHNCDLYLEGYAGGSKFERYQNKLQREAEKRATRISRLESQMWKIQQRMANKC
jgi:hypothetical protein